jgi:hypothetical protein
MSAAMWERVYQRERAARAPSQTRNAQACRRRHDALRTAGLCIFCGQCPGAPLCRDCRQRQSEQRRESYRQAVESTGRTVRPYRRKGGRA